MADRRTQILDAAIAIMGEGGTRALTHRGVDRRLGLVAGSASNYFRTRGALLEAAMGRILELDRAVLEQITDGFDDLDDVTLARGVAEYAVRVCRPDDIARTRVRLGLTVVYPDRLANGLRSWLHLGVSGLTDYGLRDPESSTRALLAYTEGVMLQAIVDSAGRGTELDREQIATHVLALLRA